MTLNRYVLGSALIYLLSQSTSSAKEQATITSRSGLKRKPKFFSIEPNEGNVEVNLDLSVPFMTIPIEDKKGPPGEPAPLFNINPNGLTIFGTLLVVSAIIIPLFVKKIPEIPVEPAPLYGQYGKEHKRRDRALEFWNFDESISEILARDGPVTLCAQKIVCSALAQAKRSISPTSADKIIDGLFSHKWFKQVSNGSAIEEAVVMGQKVVKVEDCNAEYNGCILSQQIISNLLKIIGV